MIHEVYRGQLTPLPRPPEPTPSILSKFKDLILTFQCVSNENYCRVKRNESEISEIRNKKYEISEINSLISDPDVISNTGISKTGISNRDLKNGIISSHIIIKILKSTCTLLQYRLYSHVR